jgi:outer membrane protein, heavy metal efflux system
LSFHIVAARAGFACLVACVAAGEALAQASVQPLLTLQDAFGRALVDAPAMQAADQARLGAEAGVRQADRAPNPTLDITAENLLGSGLYSGVDRSETTLALSQRLEWGEDRQARTSLAAADIIIAEANGDIRRQDLLYQVELAYLAVQKADADLAVALERAEVAREIVMTVQRRVDAARDPLMAGAKAQTVLVDAEIGVENARRISESAKGQLASFWGGDTSFSVDRASYGLVAPSASPAMVLASPELALAEAEAGRAAAAVGVERARAEQDPTISGGFRYFQETGEVALVVGFSIPLTFADQNESAISRAHAETSRLRFEREALRRNIVREAGTARSQMDIARAEVDAIDARLLPSAEQTLTYARQGYNAGGFSYLDVLDAQRLVVQVRLQRNSALHSFHSARVALGRLTGAHAEGSAQ